jgi:hypothetical protein
VLSDGGLTDSEVNPVSSGGCRNGWTTRDVIGWEIGDVIGWLSIGRGSSAGAGARIGEEGKTADSDVNPVVSGCCTIGWVGTSGCCMIGCEIGWTIIGAG